MGKGWETELPTPPPPGCTSRPCVDAGYCPDPGPLTGNVRGRRCAAPRPQGIPYHTIPPPPLVDPNLGGQRVGRSAAGIPRGGGGRWVPQHTYLKMIPVTR